MLVDGGQVVRDLGLTRLRFWVRVSPISERIGVHLLFSCHEPIKVALFFSHILSTKKTICENNIYVDKKILYFDFLAMDTEK